MSVNDHIVALRLVATMLEVLQISLVGAAPHVVLDCACRVPCQRNPLRAGRDICDGKTRDFERFIMEYQQPTAAVGCAAVTYNKETAIWRKCLTRIV